MTADRLAQAERIVARWREPEAQCLLCGRTVEPRKRWAGHQAGCERAILMDLVAEVKRLNKVLELERDGGQGALAAMHVTLDALGAPRDEWPCVRIDKLVKRLREGA